jgi:hypothetical protein
MSTTEEQPVAEIKVDGLLNLRKPFPSNQISWLPKPTRAQTDAVKADFKQGIRCDICGAWHHPRVEHLQYVGHAALTDRLLETDPCWDWQPLASDDSGLPALDGDGGLWIKLTVCGVSRLGYGDAPNKKGGDAMKERIGDALRNAAMRFGAALDLWHKGDLHSHEEDETQEATTDSKEKELITDDRLITAINKINAGEFSTERLNARFALTDAQQKQVDDSLVLQEAAQ